MKARPHHRAPSLILFCLILAVLMGALIPQAGFSSVQLHDMVPDSGPVGTAVRLSGEGFDPDGQYSMDIGGLYGTVTAGDASGLTVTIPPSAVTGQITVTQDDVRSTYHFPFTVTHGTHCQWRPPEGLSREGYVSGSRFGTTVPASDGTFTAYMADTGVTLIAVAGGDSQPLFMAAAIPAGGAASITVDSASTARALLFLAPWIFTQNAGRAQAVLDAIAGLPETAALSDRIEAVAASGADYLEDVLVLSALQAGIAAYLANPVPVQPVGTAPLAFEEGTPLDTRMRYLNPPAGTYDGIKETRLKNSLSGPKGEYESFYTLNVDSTEGTPLDWSCLLYKLDPAQFIQGIESVHQWPWKTKMTRQDDQEMDKLRVGAKLYSRYGDIVDLILGMVLSVDTGGMSIPASSPGVYVTRSYSGNLFYGTDWWNWNTYQGAFIHGLPYGNIENNTALVGNMSVAVLDALSVIISVKDVFKDKDFRDLLFSVAYEVEKAVAFAGQGTSPPRKEQYDEIFHAALKGALKKAWGIISEMSGKKIASAVGRALLKSIDIAGKVSTVAQSGERMAGLYGNHVLALESSIIVVGKPFEPVITTFSPRRGRPGTVVAIAGYNFNPSKTDEGLYQTRVFFGKDSTDPENPAIRYEAPILHATEHTLIVTVPEGTQTGPIYVRTDTGFTGTYVLQEPYKVFTAMGSLDDVVLSVDPETVASGTILRIVGSGFPPGAAFVSPLNDDNESGGDTPSERGAPYVETKVIFDGDPDTAITFQNGSATEILVKAPTTVGTHTVQVKQGNSVCAPASFYVYDPTAQEPGITGSIIYVSTRTDGNVRDDDISLREAMMIANGELAIGDLTSCKPEDPPDCHRERNKVSKTIAGAAYKDRVEIYTGLKGTVFTVSSPLPAASGWDTYSLGNIVVDGGGTAGNAWTSNGAHYGTLENATFKNFGAGLSLNGSRANIIGPVTIENISGTGITLINGAEGNRINYTTLKGIGGHGVHLSEGARANRMERTVIEGCGGSGVFFDRNAVSNSIHDTQVTGTGANPYGLHMTGAGVHYNEIGIPGSSSTFLPAWFNHNGQFGVLIENGAHHNLIATGTVKNNGSGGIRVQGTGTDFNVIGRVSDVVPRLSEVHFNGGPGVYLGPGVVHTVVRYLSVAGNDGDGIWLEGPDCAHNQIQSCATGVDLYADVVKRAPNEGSGIHLNSGAHHNLIGGRSPGSSGWRNAICGNRDHGILIEGATSSYNVINQSHIGSLQPAKYIWPPVYYPNGVNGIVLKDGTHHNIVGDRHQWLDNHIVGHEFGAGIWIEGDGTDHNLIIGNQIGAEHLDPLGAPNAVGIQLKNGPRNNRIGRMGDYIPQSAFPPPASWNDYENILAFLSGNVISNNSEAGIVLENCGAQLDLGGKPAGANVIQNNDIGSREDGRSAAGNNNGIRILAGARGNIIGGPLKGQGNRIHYNKRAGIEFYGNILSDPRLGNRISGNHLYGTGHNQASWTLSHLNGFDTGIGILVHGQSSGNAIGVASERPNRIESSMVGVYVDESQAVSILNNHIEGNTFNNAIGGVILHNSTACSVGGTGSNHGNRIHHVGADVDDAGGIVISGGSGHLLGNNAIGTDGRTVQGIAGWGIAVIQSRDNRIGLRPGNGGNVMVKTGKGGIRLSGTGSTGNRIQGNWIGTHPRGLDDAGNSGPGIQIDDGASGNLIGGLYQELLQRTAVQIAAPNRITGNTGAGVTVHGASQRNNILYNSISANGGKGIALEGGGNASIPAPVISAFSDIFVTGRVDIGTVPAGSTIQVFSDPDGEGLQYLGQTTVLAGGAWTLTITGKPVFPGLTATATHAATGDTSEFSSFLGVPAGSLTITRTDGLSGSKPIPMPGRSDIVVLDLTVTASISDVRVSQMLIDASGSMNDLTRVKGCRLYLDADQDGRPGPVDRRLSGDSDQVFDADDGRMTLQIRDGFIEADKTQRWLLVVDFDEAALWGSDFQVRIQTPDGVSATAVMPYRHITPSGAFPLISNLWEVVPSLTDALRVIQTLCGMKPAGVEPIRDLNGDGKITLGEVVYILQYVAGLR